jgi:hypothetical protein
MAAAVSSASRRAARWRTAMAPNERARKNHDDLFPGHASTLAVTDPELHWLSPHAQRALTTLRKRIASFEAQTELAASTDFPPGK